MTTVICRTDEMIDSRDVIARIEELVDDEDRDEADNDELKALQALADEAGGNSEWDYGEVLIADHYFKTYAQQLAEDIGAIDSNASWPLTRIDWEAAANDLKVDYTEVDFDGESYWIRCS